MYNKALILLIINIMIFSGTTKIIDMEADYDEVLNLIKVNETKFTISKNANFNINMKIFDSRLVDNSRGVLSSSSKKELTTKEFWIYVSIIVFLTLFSMITSGLVVGYMSIDDLVLELKSKTGNDLEKKYAKNILPVVKDRHRLLITLLIWMAGCMESMPIFLGNFYNILII